MDLWPPTSGHKSSSPSKKHRMHTRRLTPWLYVAPALALLGFFLLYPSLYTLYLSLFGRDSTAFVGLDNYIYAFTNQVMLTSFRNNALWIVIFTTVTVFLGLIFAVLFDKVKYEIVVKSIVFMPMAISFVSASVIWKFVYAYRPAGTSQIGILNALLRTFHLPPEAWLIQRPWINNLCLIAVGIWVWTGFCMVVLSASYKSIPQQFLEAARVDGAGEWTLLWKVTFPLLMPTMTVLATTMMVLVLKVFDIVYVMTNGNFGTEVIANRMYKEMFQFRNFGRSSAIAVVLLMLVLPVMLLNLHRFRERGRR